MLVKLKVSLLPPREWISEAGDSGFSPATVIGNKEIWWEVFPPKALSSVEGFVLPVGCGLEATITHYDAESSLVSAEARLTALNSRVVKRLRREKWQIDENLLMHPTPVPQVA